MASQRDPWLDNAKLALVTLVVVGHAWAMLLDAPPVRWMYDFLYFWHIPAFVLVSGYLSRSFVWDRRHLLGLVTTLAIPYLIFEPALTWFRAGLGEEPEGPLWLVPHWAMWYLPVLFVWRLATPVLRVHWLMLPLSVVISLVGGLWSAQLFCFARALGLLPFFVLGLFLTRENLARLHGTWARVAAVVALGGITLLARDTDEWARTAFLYYDAGYADLGVTPLPGIWIRLAVIGVGLVGAAAALALVPRHRTAVTAWGSATLVVYLCHGFVVRLAEHLGAGDWALAAGAAGTAAVTLGAIVLALLLASPPVRYWLEHAVDPVRAWRARRRSRRSTAAGSGEGGSVVAGQGATAGPAPDPGGAVPVLVGDQVAHPAQGQRHQPVRPHAHGAEGGQ